MLSLESTVPCLPDPHEVNALHFRKLASLLLINKSVHMEMLEEGGTQPWKLTALLVRACQVG